MADYTMGDILLGQAPGGSDPTTSPEMALGPSLADVLTTVARHAGNVIAAPGKTARGQQPLTPGQWSDLDEAIRQANTQGETSWAPEMASVMVGAGTPIAEPGAAGAAGGRLFDYSRLADVPDVPQFDLTRYAPPRGVPATATSLNTPENIERINKFVDVGAKQGGLEWYNTQPLKEAFQSELGTEQGAQDYARYLDYVAASSPRSKVNPNVRIGSYYYALDKQGAPLPDVVKTAKGNWSVPAGQIPEGYGSIAQADHVRNAMDVRSGEGFDLMANPKPASFAQNLQGNQLPVTIDTHNSRMIGLPRDLPNPTEYGYLERMQQAAAAAKGMTPAQYQASGWIGAGGETGLKSSADPFVKVFEDRVAHTAEQRGLTKAEVLRQFIRGNAPLLSGAGAAGGAALDRQLGGVPDGR